MTSKFKHKSDLQHPYYQKPERERKKFRIQLISYSLLILLSVSLISYFYGIYFLPFLFTWITLTVLAPFFDVPFLVKSGRLKYYSTLLLAEKTKDSIIIHGGTLFDYYFVLNRDSPGSKRKAFILQQYLEGLLELIKEDGNPDLPVEGTTYILNQRTAEKIGFTASKPDFIKSLILLLNYPNLLVSGSFAGNKLLFPKLNNIRTFKASIGELRENKARIESLNKKIKSSINGDQ
ncbi:hypothetical protein [Salegentibacter chungangensis]|uniref:Uncharacterized protein n=1 Tax=Salegentibacter chungangensis TaxID=1335724 RepID=A0ABW3NPK9_9FLAO